MNNINTYSEKELYNIWLRNKERMKYERIKLLSEFSLLNSIKSEELDNKFRKLYKDVAHINEQINIINVKGKIVENF